MRKFAVAVALATTALAGPAFARDGAWYVGVEGGGLLVEDIDYDVRTTAGTSANNAVSVDHEYGFDADGIIGYDFGAFRAELEVGYKDANLDSITLTGVPAPGFVGGSAQSGVPVGPRTSGTFDAADGNTRILSFMLNGMFDFGDDAAGFSGFIGGGAGIARVKTSEYQLAKYGSAFVDDSDSGFAWQVIAGVRRAITQNVDFGLKYRFFNADNVKVVAGNGSQLDGRVRTHSLLASLIFNFGEPAAAPVEAAPPPPPPPPVAPPPPPPPAPGPFIVFFDWDRSDITPEAAAILDRAAEQYAATGQASVTLAGHADKSGSDAYNQGLSQRRANAVRDYLTGKGVPSGVIASEAFGESRPLVETADGVREPQNRRVEINFAGGSAAPAAATTTDTTGTTTDATTGTATGTGTATDTTGGTGTMGATGSPADSTGPTGTTGTTTDTTGSTTPQQ